MPRRQFFGIKYPFQKNDYQNFFVDSNLTERDKVRSQIMHVICTPKGQRIMNPEFGTDLIRYIFETNDSESWEAVKNEIMSSVQKYVPGVTLDDIKVAGSDDERGAIYVRVDYSLRVGNSVTKDSFAAEL